MNIDCEVAEEDLAKVPRLATGCDPTSLDLSPAEGFLLSRIDGQTSWKLLREIGGLTPEQVDLCIEEWLMQGYIDIDGRPPRVKRRESAIPEAPKPKRTVLPGEIDESQIDPSLDLDVALQREILEMEQKLDCDYFTLLGVGRDVDAREIKRAYFAHSKRFHPDRYFRKNTGDYAERLQSVFKAISEAHELLSDPASRKEIEASLRAASSGPRVETFSDPGDPKSTKQQGKPLSAVERLRQRMPFKVREGVSDEKSQQGDELYKAAEQAERVGRLADAAASLRLAVAFDPFNRDYKRALGRLQARIAREHLEELLEGHSAGLPESEMGDARRLVQEMVLHRPKDPEVVSLAARVYIELGDADRAEEFADRLAEARPEDGAHHRVRAMVHKLRGNKGHAVSELNKALELDSSDAEARKLLAKVRGASRRS